MLSFCYHKIICFGDGNIGTFPAQYLPASLFCEGTDTDDFIFRPYPSSITDYLRDSEAKRPKLMLPCPVINVPVKLCMEDIQNTGMGEHMQNQVSTAFYPGPPHFIQLNRDMPSDQPAMQSMKSKHTFSQPTQFQQVPDSEQIASSSQILCTFNRRSADHQPFQVADS